MKEIGAVLKQQREKLGLTLEDISNKTKISVVLLKAIEEGNLEYFEHDMSYVRFYLRSFCNAVDLNFDDFKEPLNNSIREYTQTLSKKKIEQTARTHDSIAERMGNGKKYNPNLKLNQMKKQKGLDLSMISMIAVIALMACCILYGLVRWVPSMMNKPREDAVVDSSASMDPAASPVQPERSSEEEEPLIAKSSAAVNEIDAATYEIVDWKDGEEISLAVGFHARTWVQISIDGSKTENPTSRIYEDGESIEIDVLASEGKQIGIHLGYYRSNEFEINGEKFEINPEIAELQSGQEIVFIFQKGADE